MPGRCRRPCWWRPGPGDPPHSLDHARPYPAGWRCDAHSPWARAGWPAPVRPTTTKETH